MSERAIIFTGESIRAILEDRKTQTRRVISPQPSPHCAYVCKATNGWAWTDGSTRDYDYFPKDREALTCPYGVPGDRLWVREGYALQASCDGDAPPFGKDRPIKFTGEDGLDWLQPHYRATDPPPDLCCEEEGCKCCAEGEPGPHWKPSIFMPRWASRIALELTYVRVQRVQEINEEDARAEGIDGHDALVGQIANPYRTAYADLWDAINAKREHGAFAWDRNPWVWYLSFRRLL